MRPFIISYDDPNQLWPFFIQEYKVQCIRARAVRDYLKHSKEYERPSFFDQEFHHIDGLNPCIANFSNLHILVLSCLDLEQYKKHSKRDIESWIAKTGNNTQFHVIIQITNTAISKDTHHALMKHPHSSTLVSEMLAIDFEQNQTFEILQLRINEHHEGNWIEIMTSLDNCLLRAVSSKIQELQFAINKQEVNVCTSIENFSEIFCTRDELLVLHLSAGNYESVIQSLKSMELVLEEYSRNSPPVTATNPPIFKDFISSDFIHNIQQKILTHSSVDILAFWFYYARRLVSVCECEGRASTDLKSIEDRLVFVVLQILTRITLIQSLTSRFSWASIFCSEFLVFMKNMNFRCSHTTFVFIYRLKRKLLVSSLKAEGFPDGAKIFEDVEMFRNKWDQEKQKLTEVVINQASISKWNDVLESLCSELIEFSKLLLNFLLDDSSKHLREILILRLDLASLLLLQEDFEKALEPLEQSQSLENLIAEWYHIKYRKLRLEMTRFRDSKDKNGQVQCGLGLWKLVKSNSQVEYDPKDFIYSLNVVSNIPQEEIVVPMDSFFEFVSFDHLGYAEAINWQFCLRIKFPFENPVKFEYVCVSLATPEYKYQVEAQNVTSFSSENSTIHELDLNSKVHMQGESFRLETILIKIGAITFAKNFLHDRPYVLDIPNKPQLLANTFIISESHKNAPSFYVLELTNICTDIHTGRLPLIISCDELKHSKNIFWWSAGQKFTGRNGLCQVELPSPLPSNHTLLFFQMNKDRKETVSSPSLTLNYNSYGLPLKTGWNNYESSGWELKVQRYAPLDSFQTISITIRWSREEPLMICSPYVSLVTTNEDDCDSPNAWIKSQKLLSFQELSLILEAPRHFLSGIILFSDDFGLKLIQSVPRDLDLRGTLRGALTVKQMSHVVGDILNAELVLIIDFSMFPPVAVKISYELDCSQECWLVSGPTSGDIETTNRREQFRIQIKLIPIRAGKLGLPSIQMYVLSEDPLNVLIQSQTTPAYACFRKDNQASYNSISI